MSNTQSAGPRRATSTWDPAQYLRYAGNRSRPFQDLLTRIPGLPTPGHPRITDLGCGPGNVTASLFDRWPGAHITGVDSSAEMLEAAAALAGPSPTGEGHLDFVTDDIADWTPKEPHDLIVSNAALQWVPEHAEDDTFFTPWIDALRPGGTLAFQVPGNFTSPSHRLIHDVAARPRWHDRLHEVSRGYTHVRTAGEYLETLTALGCAVDAWETTYVHVLPGEDPVLDWVRGTALRPVLAALDDPQDRADFTAEYATLLRAAYPPGPAGTLFPFRRIFVIATKPGPAPGPTPGGDDPAARVPAPREAQA
jgi:trans-aconitate 2-methyltransferase